MGVLQGNWKLQGFVTLLCCCSALFSCSTAVTNPNEGTLLTPHQGFSLQQLLLVCCCGCVVFFFCLLCKSHSHDSLDMINCCYYMIIFLWWVPCLISSANWCAVIALLAIQQAFNGNPPWPSGTDPCASAWIGVTCDGTNTTVTNL